MPAPQECKPLSLMHYVTLFPVFTCAAKSQKQCVVQGNCWRRWACPCRKPWPAAPLCASMHRSCSLCSERCWTEGEAAMRTAAGRMSRGLLAALLSCMPSTATACRNAARSALPIHAALYIRKTSNKTIAFPSAAITIEYRCKILFVHLRKWTQHIRDMAATMPLKTAHILAVWPGRG